MGDQIARNTAEFSYWILSDDAKNLFGDIFKKHFREKSFSKEEDKIEKDISDIENYTHLPYLINHNQAKRHEQEENLLN